MFNQFTNLYSLSKTLRFELKPIWETQKYTTQDWFFNNDIKKDDLYVWMKDKMDEIHRKHIETALGNIQTLDISKDIIDVRNNKKTKELDKYYKNLRTIIASEFKWSKNLLEKEVIDLLIKNCPEDVEKIKEFKWFFGYFKTYTQNRANLYKNEDKAGQIAFRLIDENLPRFFKGKQIIEEIIDKYPDLEEVIEKNEKQVEKLQSLSDYLQYFDLDQYHNYLSQGGIDSYNTVIWQINFSINQYKQKTWTKIALLPLLYKLPLAPRKTPSRLPQQLSSMDQVYKCIQSIIYRIDQDIIPFVSTIFDPDKWYDYQGIYVTIKTSELRWSIALTGRQSLRWLTHKISKDWWEDSPKDSKFPFVSLADIFAYLDEKQSKWEEIGSVFGEKASWIQTVSYSKIFQTLIKDYIHSIIQAYQSSKNDYLAQNDKQQIKVLLDHSLTLWRLVGWFALIHKRQHLQPPVRDSSFYDDDHGLDTILNNETYPDPIHTLYDKIRNYMTQKPYSNDEKIKVNFENPTLLDGRDQNKEKENFGIILKNDQWYFLAVMKKWNNNFFDEKKNPDLYNNNWSMQKMIYKQMSDPSKDIPNLIEINWITVRKTWRKDTDWINRRLEEIKNKHLPVKINNIRINRSYLRSSTNFNIEDLSQYIEYYQQRLINYHENTFDFNFNSCYEDWNAFTKHISDQTYLLKRKNIDQDKIMQAVEKWTIYLFQIYNKDFNEFATGKENIHTKYFKALFESQTHNLFKLNGEAEIFRRKGQHIDNISNRVSPKHKIEIIDKKRYTQDKLMFHMPITLNFCRAENSFNKHLNETIKTHKDEITILWIDRGEKHLLYYSLIRQDGTIIKTGSWNMIGKVDYHAKLDEREAERDEAQANREQQEQIKDLKQWYISQVIHEICKIVIEHNAIIILEDLNGGFKRSRQKVEKNVYQQFELALAKKLNYLIFKDKWDHEVGGIHQAYQLTPPVSQFQDLSFQTGIMFYTAPWYTSTTCPCCGWRKNLYIDYKNEEQAKEVLKNLAITKIDKWYEIGYTVLGDKKLWSPDKSRKLATHWQIRYHYDTKTKLSKIYDMDKQFNELFETMSDYQTWLSDASVSQCKSLIRNLAMLMKIRNSQTGTDIDIIQCPACGFNSRDWFQGNYYNGDANGAYNIARKGKLILDKLVAEWKTTIRQDECDWAWMK